MNSKKFKHWPDGWFESPDSFLNKKKEAFWKTYIKIGGGFFLGSFLIILILLGVNFFAKIYSFKSNLQANDVKNFEKIFDQFEDELNILIEKNDLISSEQSLSQASLSLKEEYGKILDNVSQIKIFLPRAYAVYKEKKSLTDFAKEIFVFCENINVSLNNIKNIIDAHRDILQRNSKFDEFEEVFNEAYFIFSKLSEHKNAILSLMGDRYPKHYMVLLQNSSELRPTGGFIGGYITFDMDEGYVQNIQYFDVYQGDGQLIDLPKNEIPEEISVLSGSSWGLRDANISPDFSISAKNVMRFLEQTNMPTADPVVAIDLEVVKRFLDLVPEVKIDEFNVSFNSANFETILEYIVESKLSGETNPKEIFKKIIPAFLEAIKHTKTSLYDLSVLTSKLVRQQHVQAYSDNPDIEVFFEDYGVANKIFYKGGDFLQVVEISVGGNKTDRWIEESIDHISFVKENGEILNQVVINRKNVMNEEKLKTEKDLLQNIGFDALNETVESILFTGVNKDKFRVYVPKDSLLMFADGVDYKSVETKFDGDLNLSYFSFESALPMNTSQKIVLGYQLPYKLELDSGGIYNLQILKQSGKNETAFSKTISLDKGLNAYRFYPNSFQDKDGSYLFEGLLDANIDISVLVGD